MVHLTVKVVYHTFQVIHHTIQVVHQIAIVVHQTVRVVHIHYTEYLTCMHFLILIGHHNPTHPTSTLPPVAKGVQPHT